MDNKPNNKKKESKSMYIYTALIFVVALLLIIMAFFGQTNISRLGNRVNELEQETYITETPVPDDEFARISNLASEMDKENTELKSQIKLYELLTGANALAQNGDFDGANTLIGTIDKSTLNENQKILYDEIIKKINEGKGE